MMIRGMRRADLIFSGCCSKVSLKLNSQKLYRVEGTCSNSSEKVLIVLVSQLKHLQGIAPAHHQLP